MCGIAGFVDYRGRLDESSLTAMADSLAHRGPNASGIHLHRQDEYALGFAHRRLSIIDLSAGANQPFASDDGNYRLVFNGEIYNYPEIRHELEGLGHSFHTHGDTEVLLHALIEWGRGGIAKCIGMFAFAFFDQKKQELLLCRDRAGVKPLYYYWKNGLFLFASELKAFHQVPGFEKTIDMDALGSFFRYAYIPAPRTIFRDTHKLPGGHLLTLNLRGGEPRVEPYWDILDSYGQPRLELSDAEVIDETEKLLTSAFRYRMVSDVPVGVFLSGGYDSALVATLLQKESSVPLRTFTIGFGEEGYDEAPAARAIAKHLGTDHHEHYCTAADAAAILPRLPEIYDEPFGDSSQIPTILVSQVARRDVTVVLSGDGGDENFCGYPKYLTSARIHAQANRIPAPLRPLMVLGLSAWRAAGLPPAAWSPAAARMGKIAEILRGNGPGEALRKSSAYFNRHEVSLLRGATTADDGGPLGEKSSLLSGLSPLEAMMALDSKTYLAEDILTKVDRASMSVGLEAREPLLDHRVSEWAARLPQRFKLRDGRTKWVARQVLHRHVPPSLMERPKMGFGIPIFKWLEKDMGELIHRYLSPAAIARHGLLRPGAVEAVVSGYFNGGGVSSKDRNDRVQRLWLLLMFQMWHARWMEGEHG